MNRIKYLKFIFVVCMTISLSFDALSQVERKWGDWTKWGDQKDSTYLNPIIPSDYSDIDCIRVGDDYYAISSTFQFSPGMTLLHSKDLVNWEICSNIVADLTQIGPELSWKRMNRPARGIWAGTLRHHEGRFYLYFGTPDEGFFMTSSPSPKGPWEPLVQLLDEGGWDDCTVMWDEDGKACFIGTHFADNYKTYLFKMSPDGKSIDRKSAKLINEGYGREASKLIKVGDWYYLIFSEHRDGIGRYVLAKRSKRMMGPYKEEKQLAVTSWEAHEPNQGGIVLGKDNNWYFLTHHGSGDWSGRIVSLLPVTWKEGWPIIGEVLPSGLGSMQWTAKMPSNDGGNLSILRSDDFDGLELSPQWQWNYQPRKEMFSLSERKGWMRMKAYKPLQANQLLKAGNTLTQRTFRNKNNEVVIKLDVSALTDGSRTGLCHFSDHSSALGIVQEGSERYIEFRHNDQCKRGEKLQQNYIWLKTEWGLDGVSHYSYSLNGDTFIPFGEPYPLRWGNYRGDRIGIYCFNDKEETGLVDVDYLHYK